MCGRAFMFSRLYLPQITYAKFLGRPAAHVRGPAGGQMPARLAYGNSPAPSAPRRGHGRRFAQRSTLTPAVPHVPPAGLSAYIRLGGCRGFARARVPRARARPCVGLPLGASAGRKTIGTAGGSYRSHPWRGFSYEF